MCCYIDNGFSGKRFDRPAFQEMLQDIENGKIDCIVVKDLSRLGRDYITVGYYLEMFFPRENVRFVLINDQFDTIDGITNRDKSICIQSRTRIPLINLFNEQVSIETKKKVEVILEMSEASLHRFSMPGLAAWRGTLTMAMAVGTADP